MFTDAKGDYINKGDIVVFTEPGAGRNLPGLKFGEVIDFGKASVKVFYLDKHFRRVQVEEKVEDRSGPPYYVAPDGQEFYHHVGTGIFIDKIPVSVKYYDDRFLIVGRV
jgi:hypothetical protein